MGTKTAPAKTDSKPAAPLVEGLIGSNVQPAQFKVDDLTLTLGDVVTVAHAESGLTVEDWNALEQEDRETRIAGALKSIENEAAAEKRRRDATAGLLAAKRPAAAPVAALPAAEAMAMVYDTTARAGTTRSHEIVIGRHPDGAPHIRAYALASDKPTPMPIDHAMKFLVDKAFRVLDANGNVITPIVKPEGERANIRLDPDEVIARLAELSSAALLKRAKMLPGSEAVGSNSADEDIIAFILAAQPRNAVGVARGSEGIVEDDAAANLVDVRVPATV